MRLEEARNEAIQEARRLTQLQPVYLDTETTGLKQYDQICDIAVIDTDGTTLLDVLVKPTIAISQGASAIHHITDSDVETAPMFDDILPRVLEVVKDRILVIYNRAYDLRMIEQAARAVSINLDDIGYESAHCAMELFAQFYGEWNDYHQSFRWQKLNFAARHFGIPLPPDLHRARADTELTRLVMLEMANAKLTARARSN